MARCRWLLGSVGAVLLTVSPAAQVAAQLEKSISGHDLHLPKALPDKSRTKLRKDFASRCPKGPAYAKVCCFTIAIDACKDPVLGIGCEPSRLVGYDGCIEEACEISCPIPEARETFERYQGGVR